MKIGLKSGMKGAIIERLQRTLLSAGHKIIPAEIEATLFGTSTLAAMQEFQSRHGLRHTKQVNKATLDVLLEIEERITISTVGQSRRKPGAKPDRKSGRQKTEGTAGATPVSSNLPGTKSLPNAKTLKNNVTSLLLTSPALKGLANGAQLASNFVAKYASWSGSISDFWKELAGDPKFETVVPHMQLTLQMGALTLNNPDMVTALQSAVNPSKFRDLTQLTPSQLTNLITTNNIQVPSTIPGTTTAEKASNYASAMMSLLVAAHPTDFVANGLRNSADDLNKDVATFLANSPNFDFGATNVDSYIKANSATAFNGIESARIQALTTRIKSIQRLFRVNPDPTIIQVLLAQGLDSARKIASVPQATFMRKYSQALGGTSAATLIYNSARQIAGTVSNLYRNIQEILEPWNPSVIGNSIGSVSDTLNQVIPNWQTLFGSTSYCECDECSAMDGPNAYFVDLLQFLQNSTTGGQVTENASGYTPLDVLIGYQNNPNNYDFSTTPPTLNPVPQNSTPPLGRRPDLAYLKLTCSNSDTPLPYVDLINEILESYVYYVGMQGQSSLPTSSNNTPSDATPDELSLNPENILQDVYSAVGPLVTAIYPFNIPYDRFLDTARIYLNFLGSSRYQLIQTFGVFQSAQDEEAMLAAEFLSISQAEYQLITGLSFQPPSPQPPQVYALYGYQSTNVTQPNSTGTIQTLSWDQWLVQVPEFLKRTGLAYADLVSLLETEYLNPGQSILLQAPSSDPCNLDLTVIIFPDSATQSKFFLNVPPFLRLLNKLGWQISELDKALGAMNTGGIDRNFFLAVSQLKQLQGILNLPVTQLLTLWANIDADGRDSLYMRLFQNKTVISPTDQYFQLAYRASLPSLPSGKNLPTSWSDGSRQTQAVYDSPDKLLEFFGTMTDQQRDDLLTWAGSDDPTILAVQNLFNERWYQGTDIAAPISRGVPLICYHLNAILAALQVSSADLSQIAADTGLIPPGADFGSVAWAVIGGTPAAGDSVKLTMVTRSHGVVRSLSVSYTVKSDDTPSSIAASVASLVNADSTLQESSVSATPQGALINLNIPPLAGRTVNWAGTSEPASSKLSVTVTQCPVLSIERLSSLYRYSVLAAALNLSVTDFISLKKLTGINPFSLSVNSTVNVGGAATAGDKITLTMTSSGVTGSPISITYTVTAADKPATIAANLAAQVNSNSQLNASGISASVSGAAITLYAPTSLSPYPAWTASIAPSQSGIAASETVSISSVPLTNNTFQFIKAAQMVASSKFSIPQLGYLYRGLPDAADSLPPLQAALDQLAVSLSAGLQKIATANAFTSDPTGSALQKKLSVLLSADQVGATMNLINGSEVFVSPLAAFPTGVSLLTVTTLTVGGTATAGDKLTLTLISPAMSQSPINIFHIVSTNDNPDSIAPAMASRINSNSTLTAAGISATSSGAVITLFAPTSITPLWTAGIAPARIAGFVTETVKLSVPQSFNFINTATMEGTASGGDTITLTVRSSAVTGSPMSIVHSVSAADTPLSIASDLAAQINSDSALSSAGISASATGPVISMSAPTSLNPYPVWTQAVTPAHAGGVATEKVTLSGALTFNGLMTYSVMSKQQVTGASPAFLKAVNLLYNQFQEIFSQNLSFLASSNAYSVSLSESPLSVDIPPVPPGQVTFVTTLTVGGTPKAGDTLTVTMTSSGVTGSPVSVVYPVTSIDTLNSIAKNIALLVNSNPHLSAAGITATALGHVISLSALASLTHNTTWTVSPGAIGVNETLILSGILTCNGPMSFSTLDHLLSLHGASTAFTKAINELYIQAWETPGQTLTGSSSPAEAYNYVLGDLLAFLRLSQSQSLVKQVLSQGLNLDPALVAVLLQGNPTQGALLPSQTIPGQPAMIDFLGGLLAIYYEGRNLTGSYQTQVDQGIQVSGVSFESAQWLGRIVPPTTDTYTFKILSNTTAQLKLWVADQLVIDTVSTQHINSSINLTAGEIYDFQLSLMEVRPTMELQLQWSAGSQSAAAIPSSAFVLGADPLAAETGHTYAQGGIYSTLSLLYRVALLVNGFSMKTDEVNYLSMHPTDFQGTDPGDTGNTVEFDLSALPLDYFPASNQTGANPDQGAIDLKAIAFFNQWQRLNNLYNVKSGLPSGNVGLFDVFQAASRPGNAIPPVSQKVINTFLQATAWNPSDFNALINASGFNLSDLNFTNEIWLVSLTACLSMGNRLGLPTLQLFNWAANPPDAAQAQDIINTVKAKYDDATWVMVGKPLNDKIRENSKAALITYILNMPAIINMGFMDANDLYDYFLIDVQMCTCMITSRVVQATAAVQQFVQRCLLNLENGNSIAALNVSPSAIDGIEWESWRKNYRVWQAAVQVFLYPENWIDPTLRDDRTPQFINLQNRLLQGTITEDNVEEAYLGYLEDLRQVSRLEIVGMYLQTDTTTGANLVRVFGRTYSSPRVYFYRTLDNNTNVWSPWEKVDVEITGDQLIPVIWNNRLFIFWPSYKEVSDSNTNSPGGASGGSVPAPPPPKKTLEVRMSWSEYRQGKWTKKQTTPDSNPLIPALYDYDPNGNVTSAKFNTDYAMTLDTTQFSFHTTEAGGKLTIWMFQNHTYPASQNRNSTYASSYAGYFTFSGVQSSASQSSGNDIHGADVIDPFFTWDASWVPKNMDACAPAATELTLYQNVEMNVNPPAETPFVVLKPIRISAGYGLMFPQAQGGYYPVTSNSPVFFFQDSQRTFYVMENSSAIVDQLKNPSHAAPSYSSDQLRIHRTSENPQPDTLVKGSQFDVNQYLPNEQWKHYLGNSSTPGTLIQFLNHYHPWVGEFIKILNWKDIPGLLDITTQELGTGWDPNVADRFEFGYLYGATSNVAVPYPQEIVDYSEGGAYSIYNWELFFHIPLLIATQLSQNQQFADAQKWFHYIFNPTIDSDGPAPNRYWNFFLFYQTNPDANLADLLNTLMNPSSAHYQDTYSEVTQWWANPFDPDLVARLRPAAYQKTVVMKYIDNLIAWGDNLFSQNTRESINEATQIYVLADKILGSRPVMVPPQGIVLPVAYKDLQWNAVDNAYVQLENQFPFTLTSNPSSTTNNGSSVVTSQGGPTTGTIPYFCTPMNSQLLGYWDTVADRLYKIRHCMNIQGQVQQLSLFAPPINPALLVQAAAAGVDLSSVLGDINAAVPEYRFSYMLAKALDLSAEVRALGSSLLSALEKKDSEALALLRAGQELSVLQAILQIKQNQINEANSNLQALQDSLAVVASRQAYYQGLISSGPLNSLETGQIQNLTTSQKYKENSQTAQLLGSELSLIPQFNIGVSGFGGSPVVDASFGGQQLSTVASMVAQAFNMNAESYSFAASLSGLMAGWARRSQEWAFQLQSATLEIAQINDQIAAAQFRATIAQQDFDNQNLQIANSQAINDFLTSKFTNEDLYSWMIDQLSAVFFQCYQMAYDLAKRAEACFRFELGLPDSNYIQFGYWDSLKQGLLSGEKLYLDLKRLEGAFMDQNKREYEITRSISLVLLDPIALITLKETGQCLVNLPEAFFDMDYPGQYMRRIKSLSLTIPCVTGPYTSVNCTLTLVQSKIRWDNTNFESSYPESPVAGDPRFFYNFALSQSIATSTAQNDSGMFEVNFRDERYLPFEGAGAVSQWLISMPQDTNDFDFETITDVILNLKYTARDGGEALRDAARTSAVMPPPQLQPATSSQPEAFPSKQTGIVRYFSLKHEFPTEWSQFLHPSGSANSQVMYLPLTHDRFPFQYRGKEIKISQVELFLKFKPIYPPDGSSSSTPLQDYANGKALPIGLTPSGKPQPAPLASMSSFMNGVPYASIMLSAPAKIWIPTPGQPSSWTLTILQSDIQNLPSALKITPSGGGGPILNHDVIDDLFLVCHYSVS